MEKTVQYKRSQVLRKHLERLIKNGGWLALKSLERFLLYGILPALQKHSSYCFSSRLQDDSSLERGTSRMTLPAELADSIGPLSDQYGLTPASFTRRALWLAIEIYIEANDELGDMVRISKEEFRRYAAAKVSGRIYNKIH